VALVRVEKRKAFHHPGVEAAARMPCDLTSDVKTVLEPRELAPGRRWEDGDLAVLALIPVLRYVLAMVSETRLSVV